MGASTSSLGGYTSPPYYPAPNGGWVSDWTDAYAKAYDVVSNMTLVEKVCADGIPF
jgi:beta-glucosidase